MNHDPSRAEALFLAAAAIADPRERADYLDRECGGDLALRQRVEALLSSHDEAGTFLEPTAPSPGMESGFARLNPKDDAVQRDADTPVRGTRSLRTRVSASHTAPLE